MGSKYSVLATNENDCGWNELYSGKWLIVALWKVTFNRYQIVDFKIRRGF